MTPSRTDPVRCVIVLPADPADMSIGGIASFVRSFVKFAPPNFDISMIGVSSEAVPWTWTPLRFEGRSIQFMSASRAPVSGTRHVPVALSFSMALLRHGQVKGLEGSILQFHRPATDLPFRGVRSPRLRFVHLTTDDLTQAGSESHWRRLGYLLDRLEHASFRRMEHTYIVNAAGAETYRRRWPDLAGRISFLPNFFDDSIFRPMSASARAAIRGALATEHRFDPNARIALFAGRLEGQKDPHLLLEAFSQVLARDRHHVLLIAGEGSLRSDVEARAEELGIRRAVRFLSTVPRHRLNELMNAASVLVISSRFETGPTTGYEALATGLPVATTPVGEIARIVTETGSGVVAGDFEPGSLAAALAALLGQPTTELRERALAAGAPFAATAVLESVYSHHQSLARAMGDAGDCIHGSGLRGKRAE